MSINHIFISHSSKDDDFVRTLRLALEARNLTVWTDSRNLRGSSKLAPEIANAIKNARQIIFVLSPNTINSPWIRGEIDQALSVERQRLSEGYRIIPLLLPGIEPSALQLWFDEESIAERVAVKAENVSEAIPNILAALGERLPSDYEELRVVEHKPIEELLLRLADPVSRLIEGQHRITATAIISYEPADIYTRSMESRRYTFTAPIGPVEIDELRWYLESYHIWPAGVFRERAANIEKQLPRWGQELYKAIFAHPSAQSVIAAWQQHSKTDFERRFSILVDYDLPQGSTSEQAALIVQAANSIFSLPWELLHDSRGFIFQGQSPVRVRRRVPNRRLHSAKQTNLPIRILLVSPRPEGTEIDYFDHRIIALPLLEAIETLGELAILTVLTPPTFPALMHALQQAKAAGESYTVLHFDGHGSYKSEQGHGGLYFESPQDIEKSQKRAAEVIDSEQMAILMRDYRIPLVFLETCQWSQGAKDPTAAIAVKLLEEGVSSVVTMNYRVLIESARRFVTAFYQVLANGARVGTAMLAGQRVLYDDSFRGHVLGAGELHLQDWFVPVLYQELQDIQIVTQLPSHAVRQVKTRVHALNFGALPASPPHSFIGRSRELLALERMLTDERQRYVVVLGPGGAGKTTLAVELARWLVRTQQFERAAFVSLDQYSDVRAVLDAIGQQLLPNGKHWSVAHFNNLNDARQAIVRTLRDRSTIIVLDNLESVLLSETGFTLSEFPQSANAKHNEVYSAIFDLCCELLDASNRMRLIFTSRTPLPEPFAYRHRTFELHELDRNEAIELVSQVLKREGLEPKYDDAGNMSQEVVEMVEAVGCHARALTLLAPELARRGVRATTAHVQQIMAELDRQHPGDRENSLYASVALSLRRLSSKVREQCKVLGVFHSGANLAVLAMILDLDEDAIRNFAHSLIEVGLAEEMGYGYLRLDPALPSYLLRELSAAEQDAARSRWATAMTQLTAFLYQQLSQDAELATHITLLELPNLIALLQWMQASAPPEEVVDLANRVESLFAYLGRPQVLAQATRVREQAAAELGDWSPAHFLTASAQIDRMLERGDLRTAYASAQQLLQRALVAGEDAFPTARYHIAMTYLRLGRVLRTGGQAQAALPPLAEAQQRLQALADVGDTSAARMASVAITEAADCSIELGRIDEAASAYQEAIRRAEKLDDQRQVAINKFQLGYVLMLQKRYAEALSIYAEARGIFERLGEPGSVAVTWHQLGRVYKETKQFEQAERAYQQSLAIKVQHQNLTGEASSLNELGNLYDEMGRLEEALKCYRQAADITVKLQDQRDEGTTRNNLATTLIKLERYDEARRELHRAIECKQSYGPASQPWTTWALLSEMERAIGDMQAADQARERAFTLYLQYRRDGGQSMQPGAQLCRYVAQVLQANTPEQRTTLAAELDALLREKADVPKAQVLLPKLQSILRGSHDATLADDPALDYDDAVELKLLLNSL